jgi:hypothetical protein
MPEFSPTLTACWWLVSLSATAHPSVEIWWCRRLSQMIMATSTWTNPFSIFKTSCTWIFYMPSTRLQQKACWIDHESFIPHVFIWLTMSPSRGFSPEKEIENLRPIEKNAPANRQGQGRYTRNFHFGQGKCTRNFHFRQGVQQTATTSIGIARIFSSLRSTCGWGRMHNANDK